jgi:hypothetical protein
MTKVKGLLPLFHLSSLLASKIIAMGRIAIAMTSIAISKMGIP